MNAYGHFSLSLLLSLSGSFLLGRTFCRLEGLFMVAAVGTAAVSRATTAVYLYIIEHIHIGTEPIFALCIILQTHHHPSNQPIQIHVCIFMYTYAHIIPNQLHC